VTSVPLALLAALPASVPVDISRDGARDAALRELAKPPYHEHRPGLFQQVISWLLEQLLRLLELAGGGNATTGFLGLLIIAAIVVLTIIAIRLKLGPFSGTAAPREALFAGPERTAAEHRKAAEAFAADANWPEAIRERLRAIIRECEQRGVLDPRPGRTADEAAADAGAALPDCAPGLRSAARIFDDVWYGRHDASAGMNAELRTLDEAVQAARRAPLGAAR
jgi:hypothetical protein